MSSPRPASDPERLEVQVLARRAGTLQGEWSAEELPRLAATLWQAADGAVWPTVQWSVRGSVRKPPGSSKEELWLQLQASTPVRLQCQRCLGPCDQTLTVDRSIRFVATEEEAQRLDEEIEEDVLAYAHKVSAKELVEDELILALPLVAMHEQCPRGLGLAPVLEPQTEPLEVRENPFAVLAGWRKNPGQDPSKNQN
jgi:uncharacterized protein